MNLFMNVQINRCKVIVAILFVLTILYNYNILKCCDFMIALVFVDYIRFRLFIAISKIMNEIYFFIDLNL